MYRPVRLSAQDTGLSSRRKGFESPTGYGRIHRKGRRGRREKGRITKERVDCATACSPAQPSRFSALALRFLCVLRGENFRGTWTSLEWSRASDARERWFKSSRPN